MEVKNTDDYIYYTQPIGGFVIRILLPQTAGDPPLSDDQQVIIAMDKKIIKLQAELEKHRWIPVGERLPELPKHSTHYESSKGVWVIYENTPQKGYYTNFNGWNIHGIRFQKRMNQNEITHWQEIILPEDE